MGPTPEHLAKREQHRLYMQRWRRRQADGHEPRRWTPYTDEQKAEALRLRESGFTFREIGEKLDIDFSGIARHVKRMTAAQSP